MCKNTFLCKKAKALYRLLILKISQPSPKKIRDGMHAE